MAPKIIESIHYSPTQYIRSFIDLGNGLVNIEVKEWIKLPMTPASGIMEYTHNRNDQYAYYTVSVNARLTGTISPMAESLFNIRLCNGEEWIIGTPYIPVLSRTRVDLGITRFDFSHKSTTPPFRLNPIA